MLEERRRFRRLPVVWKASVIRLNGECLTGSTDNVSREGLNIILPRALVQGEPCRIDLVTRCPGRTCCFSFEGVAVYSDPLGGQLGVAVGFQLTRIDPEFTRLVEGLELAS